MSSSARTRSACSSAACAGSRAGTWRHPRRVPPHSRRLRHGSTASSSSSCGTPCRCASLTAGRRARHRGSLATPVGPWHGDLGSRLPSASGERPRARAPARAPRSGPCALWAVCRLVCRSLSPAGTPRTHGPRTAGSVSRRCGRRCGGRRAAMLQADLAAWEALRDQAAGSEHDPNPDLTLT